MKSYKKRTPTQKIRAARKYLDGWLEGIRDERATLAEDLFSGHLDHDEFNKKMFVIDAEVTALWELKSILLNGEPF